MADTHLASSLVCQEDGASLEEEEEEEKEEDLLGGFDFDFDSDGLLLESDDDEYIGLLVSKEGSFDLEGSVPAEKLLVPARTDAVSWILKTAKRLNFGLRTAYIASVYLDRFFLHRIIDRGKSWAVRLLSIACLSLAAKMEENKSVILTEFQSGECLFECEAIRRMELLVLATLRWRMIAITPFSFLGYFAAKLHAHAADELIRRAIGFIFSSIRVISAVDHRPSVIACASVLASSNEKLTQQLVKSKLSSVSALEQLDNDHVYSCYSMMIQEANKGKIDCSSNDISVSGISSIGTDHTNIENRCSKRRRLQFPNND